LERIELRERGMSSATPSPGGRSRTNRDLIIEESMDFIRDVMMSSPVEER
jgi:hypothetical protein